MIRPFAKQTLLVVVVLIGCGVWNMVAHGGSDTAGVGVGVVNHHCATVSSGSALSDDTQLRGIVGQSQIGVTSDGVVTVRAGALPCLAVHTLEPLPGDFDHNRLVNESDLLQMTICLDGPEFFVPIECEPGVFDSDGDIDLFDMAHFQRAYTGNPSQ